MGSAAFLLRRLGLVVPVLMGASVVVFLMMHLAPGDPAQAMLGPRATPVLLAELRAQLGLDQPLHVQYWRWISHVVRGDFGRSIYFKDPVTREIITHLTPTVLLLCGSLVLASLWGIGAGIVSAVYRNRWPDRMIMPSITVGVSMPSFYLGMVLIVVFAVTLGWLPTGGYMTIEANRATWSDVLVHLVLPSATLAAGPMAVIARMLRTSMLEEFGKSYVRTAHAKGLADSRVIGVHVFKNAIIPMVHLLGLQAGFLLASTALVEVVFGYPGLGNLLIQSIITRDLPLTQGIVLVMTAGYAVINLTADVMHGVLDPSIRYV